MFLNPNNKIIILNNLETYQEKMFKIAKNMVKWNKYEKNKSNLMLSYSDTILKTMFLIDNNIY